MGLLLSWINAVIGWPFLWPVLCLVLSGVFLSVRGLRESDAEFAGLFRVAPAATVVGAAVLVFCSIGRLFLEQRYNLNFGAAGLLGCWFIAGCTWAIPGWGVPAVLKRFGVRMGYDGIKQYLAGSILSGVLLVALLILSLVLQGVQIEYYRNTVPWAHTTILVGVPGNPVLQQRRVHIFSEYDLRLVFAQNGTNFAVNLPMNTGGKTEINVYLLPSQKSGETDGIVFNEKRTPSILWFPGLDLQSVTGNDVTGVLFVDYDIDEFGFPSGGGYSWDIGAPPKVVRKWSDYHARLRFLGKVDGFKWIPAAETKSWEY